MITNSMKLQLFLLLIFTPSLLFGSEQQEVVAVYKNYLESVKIKDGAVASNCVSKEVVDLYNRCYKYALNSKDLDFESLSQMEVVLIFTIRYFATEQELLAVSDPFAWGVKKGLVKLNGADQLTIDNVTFSGNKAIATLLKNRVPITDAVFYFSQENGTWKWNMLNLMEATEPIFENLRTKARKSKVELAIYLIERTYSSKVSPQILNGPIGAITKP